MIFQPKKNKDTKRTRDRDAKRSNIFYDTKCIRQAEQLKQLIITKKTDRASVFWCLVFLCLSSLLVSVTSVVPDEDILCRNVEELCVRVPSSFGEYTFSFFLSVWFLSQEAFAFSLDSRKQGCAGNHDGHVKAKHRVPTNSESIGSMLVSWCFAPKSISSWCFVPKSISSMLVSWCVVPKKY